MVIGTYILIITLNVHGLNGNQKKAGVPILISDKIDLKIKNVTRDKKGHYIMIP